MSDDRDPTAGLGDCERILIIGRTGSGKTTLARQLAAALDVPHVELDSLYFDDDFATAPLDVLRTRTVAAIAAERWVTDGNKAAVRDLVWPRADTVIWLDYPLAVSLWRLGGRAKKRASDVRAQGSSSSGDEGGKSPSAKLLAAAKGVLTALRSHRGQRRTIPLLLAQPENRHLAVARLRSPKATRAWLERVAG